jgi:DNA-binding transcriptional LysR family regulator
MAAFCERPVDSKCWSPAASVLCLPSFLRTSGLRGKSTDFEIVSRQTLGRAVLARNWNFHRSPEREQGCLYRNRAIHAIEAAQRTWDIAYTSSSLAGIQAAVTAGLGISILPEVAILGDHHTFGPEHGFPTVGNTELALVAAPEATPAMRRLAAYLVDFCNVVVPRRSDVQRSGWFK